MHDMLYVIMILKMSLGDGTKETSEYQNSHKGCTADQAHVSHGLVVSACC